MHDHTNTHVATENLHTRTCGGLEFCNVATPASFTQQITRYGDECGVFAVCTVRAFSVPGGILSFSCVYMFVFTHVQNARRAARIRVQVHLHGCALLCSLTMAAATKFNALNLLLI